MITASILLGFMASIANAAQLTVVVPQSPPLLANPATLPPSTHATLTGAPGVHYSARITPQNAMTFKNVTQGSYLLDIYTRDYTFPPCRVDVSMTEAGADDSAPEEVVEVWQTFRGNEWSNKGPKFGEGKQQLAVELRPVARREFYQQRGGFNILAFLKSPMILMALVSGALVFGMPYLMENMDEETKKEFEEMQKKSPISGSQGAAAQIQNFDLASFLAGKSSGTEEAPKGSGGNAKARR